MREKMLICPEDLIKFMGKEQYKAFLDYLQDKANKSDDIKRKKISKAFIVIDW